MAKCARKVFLIFFLCSILASTMILRVRAEEVGVSQGNVFEYDVVSHFTLSAENAPADLLELNNTKLITVTVKEISGNLITTEIKTQYKNGTEVSSSGSCDIDTGNCTGLPFIAANLQKNDSVNPSASEPWYVNETLTRNYKDGPRETNYLKFEYSEPVEAGGEFTGSVEYYFDKSTGVLVEYTTQSSYGGLTSIAHSELVSSNVWLVGDAPFQSNDQATGAPTTIYIAAAAVAVIILIAVAAVVRKKRRSSEVEIQTEE